MDEPRERTRAVAFDFVAAPCSPGDPDRKKEKWISRVGNYAPVQAAEFDECVDKGRVLG